MPTWLSPTWLWLLLLVPVYFLLHLFIHSAARRRFASLRLWKNLDQLIDRKQRSIPSLKYLITSLLLALLLASVIVSVAGPVFQSGNGKPEHLHVLVDLSASMGVQDDAGTSRYDRAIRRLERVAEQPSTPSRWTVTLLTRPIRTHDGSAREMIDLLADQSVTDLSFNRSLRTRAEDLLRERTAPLVFVTDSGKFDDQLFDQRARRLIVGKDQPNTGIVSLRASQNDSSLTLTIEVAHHGPGKQQANLTVQTLEGSVMATRQLKRSSGEQSAAFLSVDDWAGKPGVVRLNPGGDDALASDNNVYFAPSRAYRVRTELRGNNQHAEHLLSSLSTVQQVDRQPRVTVYHRPSADEANTLWQEPSSPAIVINPPETNQLPFETSSFDQPVRPIATSHPIVSDLDLQNVAVSTPLVLAEAPSSEILQPLLVADSRPITVLRERAVPQLWMGFDPFISSSESPSTLWAVHPDTYPEFIQFWQNVFAHFQGLNISRHGEVVYWETGQQVQSKPVNGRSSSLSDLPTTNQVGMHEFKQDHRTWSVPVNLNSASETDTLRENTVQRKPLEFQETVDPEQSIDRSKTINRVVLFLFLLMLILISLLHRSTAKP